LRRAAASGEVAGIINADCLLIPQIGLIKRLVEELDSLVIAERIGLSQTTLHPTGHVCQGFDAFFFATKALAGLEIDDRWRIGDSWWDYWLPLAFQVAGLKPKTLPAPMLIHLDHHQAWDRHVWESSFPRLLDFLRVHTRDLRHPDLISALEAAPAIRQVADIHELIHKIYNWLHSREPLWRPEAGGLTISFDTISHRARDATPAPTVGRGRARLRRVIALPGLREAVDLLGLR